MVAGVAICITLQKARSFAAACALDKGARNPVHGPYVLTVNARRLDPERCGAAEHVAGSGLRVMGVLVVEIVFADVDYGQLPKLRQVHYFIERSLAQGAFAEEADCNAVRS